MSDTSQSDAGSVAGHATTATIVEMSPKQMVTWTMPREVYDMLLSAMETWPLIYGRPRATVERLLAVLETGWPGVREQITREVKDNPPPVIRGHKAGVFIHDDWLYRRWVADGGWACDDRDFPAGTDWIQRLEPGKMGQKQ